MPVLSELDADLASRSLALLLGLFLFILTLVSLLRTVVMPRNLESTVNDIVSASVIYSVRGVARLRRTYVGRDSVLAWSGPLLILIQLIVWLLLFFAAYGLWIYGIGEGGDIGAAMRQAGSSLFTLGFADSNSGDVTVIDFMAAATGPIVIALLIGFLPTIYSSYIQREQNVAMLGVTAGDPSWGPELISRSYLAGQAGVLEDVFHDWRAWATQTRLTHVTYPVLLLFRSGAPNRSWVTSLLAVLDAASLQLALTRTLPRHNAMALLLHGSQALELIFVMTQRRTQLRRRIPFAGLFLGSPHARPSLDMRMPGFEPGGIAVEMAATADGVTGLPAEAVNRLREGEDRSILLTRAEFEEGVEVLRASGYPIENDLDTAWTQFSMARSRYEFTAYSLAERLDVVPAPWSGPRRHAFPTIWPTLASSLLPDVQKNIADSSAHPRHDEAHAHDDAAPPASTDPSAS